MIESDKKSLIMSELIITGNFLNGLQSAINNLHGKVSIILTPQSPQTCKKMLEGEGEAEQGKKFSKIIEILKSQNRRFYDLITQLENITDSIEI